MKKLLKINKTKSKDDDFDIPEITQAQFRNARHARDVEPDLVAASLRRKRGMQKKPTKAPISIRLSRDVVAHFKAMGAGWQTRLDDSLRRMIGL